MRTFLLTLSLLIAPSTFACTQDEFRQFDFWLGEWTVTTPSGQVAGTNKITLGFNDCVILENYATPNGYSGTSLNMYDQQTKMWHQTWVDNGGFMLRISGGLQGDAMVMKGDGLDQSGKPVKHKITWSPKEDGTVRQHWESSSDGEKTWSTLFDGTYKKVS